MSRLSVVSGGGGEGGWGVLQLIIRDCAIFKGIVFRLHLSAKGHKFILSE